MLIIPCMFSYRNRAWEASEASEATEDQSDM